MSANGSKVLPIEVSTNKAGKVGVQDWSGGKCRWALASRRQGPGWPANRQSCWTGNGAMAGYIGRFWTKPPEQQMEVLSDRRKYRVDGIILRASKIIATCSMFHLHMPDNRPNRIVSPQFFLDECECPPSAGTADEAGRARPNNSPRTPPSIGPGQSARRQSPFHVSC